MDFVKEMAINIVADLYPVYEDIIELEIFKEMVHKATCNVVEWLGGEEDYYDDDYGTYKQHKQYELDKIIREYKKGTP